MTVADTIFDIVKSKKSIDELMLFFCFLKIVLFFKFVDNERANPSCKWLRPDRRRDAEDKCGPIR